MQAKARPNIFDVLTILVLVLTILCLGSYFAVAIGLWNPLPSPTPLAAAYVPTLTPTPKFHELATWTPTATMTPGPTRTPTATPTPTGPPSLTPTIPPTPSPTPRVTRAPRPFTAGVEMRVPIYNCNWTGVAGTVVDLDGNPLVGFPVHIWGAGLDVVVTSGGAPNGYGSPAGWEQFFDSQPKEMVVNVQLHDPYRDSHPPISDVLEIRFPGPYCGSALGWVTFTKNWEDWP